MSSLTIALLLLALIGVAAVVLMNLMQAAARERRMREVRRRDVGPAVEPYGVADDADATLGFAALDDGRPPSRGLHEGASAARAVDGAAEARRRSEPRLGELDPDEASGAFVRQQDGSQHEAGERQHPPDSASVHETDRTEDSDWPEPATETPPWSSPTRSPAATAGVSKDPSATSMTAASVLHDGAAATPASKARRHSSLSSIFDCVIELPLSPPMAGERLASMTQALRRVGAKPLIVEAVPAQSRGPEESPPASEPVAAGETYRALRIGVLLANRQGPLNALEYSEFVAIVQSLADGLGALADTPDMAEVIARARDLDSTCAQLDAQIGLNVDAPEPVSPSQWAALAREADLVERGSHRYVRVGPQGEVVFAMAAADAANRVSFLLDVPRSERHLDGWSAMLACAQQIAADVNGRVVDDGGRPVPAEALSTIARQLTQRYESLAAIGVPAGSALAIRVFN